MQTNLYWKKVDQCSPGGGGGRNKREGLQKGHQETLAGAVMCIILIAAMVSQVCKYVKTHQTVPFKICAACFMSVIAQ